jgi:apolipoprotein N-acyltransferase
VWPETVYPTTFGTPKSAAGAAFDEAIAAFVAQSGVPLVFGAYDVEAGAEFNAAVFLDPPRGRSLEFETYRKAALFPLTERVPAFLGSPRVRRWLLARDPGPGRRRGDHRPCPMAGASRWRRSSATTRSPRRWTSRPRVPADR